MDKAKAGQRHIPAKDWNEIRDFINNFSLQNGGMVKSEYNQFLVTVKNSVSGVDLEPFQVVRVNSAMYPNRSADDTVTAALNGSIELDASAPTGEDGENIAIVQHDIANGDIGSAICSGATLCYVNVANANTDYKYAKSKAGETDYLEADEDGGQARIVWKQSGTGKKLAYIILDQTGTPEKETFLLYSSGNWNPSDYIKGNLEYIWYDTAYNAWVPIVTSNPQPSDFANCRLVVCQEDMPSNVTGDYKMPYYPLEDNIGVVPNKSTASGESFVNRCGVLYGEHVLSNKRIDYVFKAGRYAYEPFFITDVFAEAGSSGQSGVYCTINGVQYPVAFPTLDANYHYANFAPDIYAGDMLHVRVELTNKGDVYTITALQYPIDEQAGSVSIAIGSYGGKSGCRGWERLSVLPDPIPSGNLYVLDVGGNYYTINSCPSSQAVGSFTITKLGIEWWIKRKTNALI